MRQIPNRVERTLTEQWKTLATLAFTHCSMTYMYARTIRSWWLYTGQNTFETGCTKKKGHSCARQRKSGMHIKTSHISSATTATGTQILRATF